METTHPKPHAVMFPLHLQGHVIPAVHLAVKLASKGFTITFVNTQAIHRQIIKSRSQHHDDDQDIFAGARKSGLDIRYKTVTDGFPLSFNRSLNREQFIEGFLHVFPAHVDELVGNIIAADPSVSCLIADTFHSWPSSLAQKYNLVHISFWTEPALVFNLYYHLDLLVKNGHFASHDNREDTIDYIPGVEAIEPKDLMSYLRETEVSTLMHKIIYKAFEDVKKADFILCNTVEELELHAISAVRGKQPIYAIGPVLSNIGQNGSIVATSLRSQSDCSQWLDTKPHGSVLYVSFGSMSPVNEHDMEELAQGLLLSKVCFVWVLRPDTMSDAESYALPVGFEDDIKDRGLIVPWCNQIEVISHPAIGGFLTHCGWNSVLESIWCGVPMLCFPILTDQPTNRKLVVDDWRAGLNLCDKKPLTRFEVREKISSLMSGKSAEVLREEMKKVKEIIHNAVDKDGSSEKRICEFICQVKTKID
ncbi:UDP-glycosyltransferase 86A1-like [Ziziphus jujuba]|uniref:Glycosyltransferase n=1 Tax=Ziziphus jujuba TaxID=326968 RepID=A0A6P4ASM4_ZIZJJ|nr:UDP-glycosyltransferase 86A1-like [Ziziphus jujuba]